MGDNLIKIHLIQHIVDDILNLGLPISFDSAPGENRHISAVKIPASRTQYQMNSFYEQIGLRFVKDTVIDWGYYDIDATLDQFSNCTLNDPKDKELRSQIYHVTELHIERKTKHNKYEFVLWQDQKLYDRLFRFFSDYIFPYTDQKQILLYTEYAIQNDNKMPTEIYCADPLYRNGPWNDWVYVNWDNQGDIPAQIFIFFELTSWKNVNLHYNDTFITGPGKYALCYMIKSPILDDIDKPNDINYQVHPSSLLIKTAELMLEGD